MKIIEIPENINDLRDYNIFITAAKELNNFNKNLQKYCEKIIKTEYLKSVKNWKKILSKYDLEKLNKFNDNDILFYDYKNNKFIKNNIESPSYGWSRGESLGYKKTYSISDDGSIIIIKYIESYQKSRFSHIAPEVTEINWSINLIEKSVSLGRKNRNT